MPKKKSRPISSHLDRSSLVTKGFIIWPKRKLFLAGPTREIPSGQDGSILQNFTFNWNSLTNLANIEMIFYIRHFFHAWTSISPVHSTFQCDIRELQTWVLPPPALPRWQSPVPENHNVTYSSLPRHFLHRHFEHGNALADDVIGLCHFVDSSSPFTVWLTYLKFTSRPTSITAVAQTQLQKPGRRCPIDVRSRIS